MPCNCDHLEPTAREAESVRVIGFLQELGLRTGPYDKSYGQIITLDGDTSALCAACKALGKKIKNFSLELQIWWRDHQKIDQEKAKRHKERLKIATLLDSAKAKLTPAERKALGL